MRYHFLSKWWRSFTFMPIQCENWMLYQARVLLYINYYECYPILAKSMINIFWSNIKEKVRTIVVTVACSQCSAREQNPFLKQLTKILSSGQYICFSFYLLVSSRFICNIKFNLVWNGCFRVDFFLNMKQALSVAGQPFRQFHLPKISCIDEKCCSTEKKKKNWFQFTLEQVW